MIEFLELFGILLFWYVVVVMGGNGILCQMMKKSPKSANCFNRLLLIDNSTEYHPCSEYSSLKKKISKFFVPIRVLWQCLGKPIWSLVKHPINTIKVILMCLGGLIRSLIKHLFSVYEGYFEGNRSCHHFSNEACGQIRECFGKTFSKRSFYFNFFVGSVVLFGVLLSNNLLGLHWLTTVEDEEIDLVMQIHRFWVNCCWPWQEKGKIDGTDKEMPKFVFVDVDNDTHRQWKNVPTVIPRNYLKNLIHFATMAGAKLIIVDVNFTKQLGETSDNKELQNFLDSYQNKKEKNCNIFPSPDNKKTGNSTLQQDQKCPPIILLRTFEKSTSDDGTIKEPLKPRPTFLDDIIKPTVGPQESYNLVQWASAEFVANENLARRWWLWQPVCYGPEKGRETATAAIIPSVELLTAAMVCNNTLEDGYKDLYQQLDSLKPSSCDNARPLKDKPVSLCGGKHPIKVSGGMYGIQQRIWYSYTEEKTKDKKDDHSKKEDNPSDYLKYSSEALNIFSARIDSLVHEEEDTKAIARRNNLAEHFKNKIVLIGGSYDIGGDNHLTPLGSMSGGLIVINAINSLLRYGEINELSLLIKIASIGLFILLMSVALTHLESFDAKLLLGMVVLILLLVFGVVFFMLGRGLWVDLIFFLIVLEVFHQINEVRGHKPDEKICKELDDHDSKKPIIINREE